MSFDATAKFLQTSGSEGSLMPDGLVIYQESSGLVHYLNPTAALVYELCGAGETLGSIADFMKSAYSLDIQPIDEIEACVRGLLAEGLIERC